MSKQKHVTLTRGWMGRIDHTGKQIMQYRVEKVTNSIEWAPGDFMVPEQVEALCGANGWTVTIIPYKVT